MAATLTRLDNSSICWRTLADLINGIGQTTKRKRKHAEMEVRALIIISW